MVLSAKAVQTEMSNIRDPALRGASGCLGSITCFKWMSLAVRSEGTQKLLGLADEVSLALLSQLKGVREMPFPRSVKETPTFPTADISLTLSPAGDVQGIFLKEQWDIPLPQLLE